MTSRRGATAEGRDVLFKRRSATVGAERRTPMRRGPIAAHTPDRSPAFQRRSATQHPTRLSRGLKSTATIIASLREVTPAFHPRQETELRRADGSTKRAP